MTFDVKITDAEGHECAQTVNLAINDSTGCAFFSGMVWEAPVYFGSGAFAAGVSNAFGGSASAPDGVYGGGGGVSMSGAVDYTGVATDCCVKIISETQGGIGPASWNIIVTYDLGGPNEAPLLYITVDSHAASNLFSIPESLVATAITVELQVSAGGSEDPYPGSSASVSAIIGACP